MSNLGRTAVIEREEPISRTGEGITNRGKKMRKEIDDGKEQNKKDEVKTDELRSRFGEAFLPYATLLESNRRKEYRKRKGKNKKKKLNKINKIPEYTLNDKRGRETYDIQCTRNLKKINEKRDRIQITKENENENDTLNWYGDTMTFDEEWPNIDKRKTIRIFHINLNGITYQNNYLEWEMTIAYLMEMQVDIFGLTEINLDLNNGIVKDQFLQSGKHFDPYLRMSVSSSLQDVGESPFKMGGTVTGSNGCWSGRIYKQGSDRLGRWSFMSLQAQKGHLVTFITVYLPRKPAKDGRGTTIYQQMEADLFNRDKKMREPRQELLNDLHKFIDTERKIGSTILLMGDVNDNLGMENGQVCNFLESNGLKMTYKLRHGEESKLPATHDRGRHCIDLIGCSSNITHEAIVRAGYAPFYFNFFTDHRGTYVDLDIDSIFNCARPDTTRQIYKRFTTRHVPKCSKYLKKLEALMETSRIFQEIDALETRYQNNDEDNNAGEKERIIKRTKLLFKKVTGFMLCAEKNAGPMPYKDGFPDSPRLREIAFKVIRLKKYMRLISLGTMKAEEDEKNKIKEDIKQAQMELRNAQKDAIALRQEHLEILAEKRSHQWQMSSAEALHIIKESEKSKTAHNKHRRLLKSDNVGTLRSLMIPAPITGLENNVKDPRTYTTVHDSKVMFNILLKRNFKHLRQSKDSMFAKGPILENCGWYGEGEGMEKILEGMLNVEEVAAEYPEYAKEGVAFLKALRYTKDEDGKNTQPFEWKFGIEEYMRVFNKTKESTACGPSGLHMSHWKAACERPKIARVHAFFMWAAFAYGFTYDRWEQSWHCMIQKLKQPLLPKLRIVQLFEGDFNAGLKYLIGKKMMTHMNKLGLHDQETYGSRSGKTAPEALINLQLLSDHNRTWKIPYAIVFNDANGCYDRIVATLCELAMRARGCPKGIAQCHTQTQKRMIHRIRIASGISEGVIRFAVTNMTVVIDKSIKVIQGKIGGIGQGGGAGPLAWIAVIDVMLEAYRTLCPGAMALDPLQLYTICYWMISYVDDNTIVVSFKEDEEQKTILETVSNNLASWRRLLQLTGGDIDVEKSKWSILRWKYCTTWGIPTLENAKEFPGEIKMVNKREEGTSYQKMGRLEPWQAERVLGVRIPLDGTMKEEFNFRKKQIRILGKKIYRAPLSHWDAWIIYESRYRAIARYPLPVTMFTKKECELIQKPFIHALLPKLGMNRNMPRVVIYGPKELGGLELMDLRIEQVTAQWETTRGHLRRLDRAGHGLYINAHNLQVEIGSESPFYLLDPSTYNYATENTRWTYLWKELYNKGLDMEIYDFWTPKGKGENDSNIMDVAIRDEIIRHSKWPLMHHINRCRMYVRAFHISDLTKDGVNIHPDFMNGNERGDKTQVSIPDIRRPTTSQWKVWKSFLHRNFLSPGMRINPGIKWAADLEPVQPSRPISESKQLENMWTDGLGLKEILRCIPPSLQQVMGEITIPIDDGEYISESIVSGTCIGASDGSLKKGFKESRGGHGFALRNQDNIKNEITGYCRSPTSDEMSSLTIEHYGLLGLLVLLHGVCKRFKLCKEECFDKVLIYIDNSTVVRRGNERQELINISDYSVPDQDLWTLTTELMDTLPIEVELRWIKGHQDTNAYGEKLHGPFTRPVMMNILTDLLADKGQKLGDDGAKKRPTFSTTVIAIYTEEKVQVLDLRRYILMKENGRLLQEYYGRRRGWTQQHMEMIKWEGIVGMMKAARPIRRTKLVKMLHHWQNTGKQKGRIRDARLKIKEGVEATAILNEDEKNCHLCPEGCGEEEVELHYLDCPTERSKEIRVEAILKVKRRLKKLHTHEGIVTVVGYILTQISDREEMEFEDEDFRGEDSPIMTALEGQDEIGMLAFCQGYYHTEWSNIQQRHYASLGLNKKTVNIKRWTKMFSIILSDYCLECWGGRNESIHGSDKDTSRKKRLEALRKKVKDIYKRKSEIKGKKYKSRIFDMPLAKRLLMGIQSSKIWVGMAEEVLKMNREMAIKHTIHQWLQS